MFQMALFGEWAMLLQRSTWNGAEIIWRIKGKSWTLSSSCGCERLLSVEPCEKKVYIEPAAKKKKITLFVFHLYRSRCDCGHLQHQRSAHAVLVHHAACISYLIIYNNVLQRITGILNVWTKTWKRLITNVFPSRLSSPHPSGYSSTKPLLYYSVSAVYTFSLSKNSIETHRTRTTSLPPSLHL